MKKKFGFVLAAAILLAGCGQKKETTTTTARPVKTTIVESRSIIRKDFSGIVEAVEYVKLAFRVNGQIIQLPVIEGQKVKKGQLIAAIDPRDIALQYAATKSAYETASAQVERNKRLLSRQAISVQEYEISLANFQKAKSEYELSANNMRDTKLTAPFDGSIEKRLVETISVSTPVKVSFSLSTRIICVSNSPFRMLIFICCAPKIRVSLLSLIPSKDTCFKRNWKNIWIFRPMAQVSRSVSRLTTRHSTVIFMQ